MLSLNLFPRVAVAARHNPVWGVTALLADGFVSGSVLAPILPDREPVLAWNDSDCDANDLDRLWRRHDVRDVVELDVFSAARTHAGMLIAAGIGIFGVCILVYATSSVLYNPDADSPIPGALILFAGLFNVCRVGPRPSPL